MQPKQICEIVDWFKESARPFLKKVQPEKIVEELEKDLTKLVQVEQLLPTDFTVCFLGSAGVGKSTLINALVRDHILPTGGIGPLTAQALTVRYSKEPRFEVQYHPFQNLWRLIFGLEKSHKNDLLPLGPHPDASPPDIELSVEEEEQESSTIAEPDTEYISGKRLAYRKLAQLLVTGNQENLTEVAYLADSLRQAIGKARIWGTNARDSDQERIAAIHEAIELAKDNKIRVRRGSPQDAPFLKELRNHASGFLAPLIKDLAVYWTSDLLDDGVTLVDLPGVGISGDVYRDVTRKWIREKAEAVVLVVDRSGITESAAELLRKSEFLNRLVYTADDPTRDPILMVAVVKIDDVAEGQWREDKSRPKPVHFAEVCEKTIPFIREQVRQQLEATWPSEQGQGNTRRQVVENILSTLQVHPMSAIQYRMVLANDEEERPFLRELNQSNVPHFQQCLRELGRKRKAEHQKRLTDLRDVFLGRILSIIRVTQAQWEEETRASDEAEQLREDLAVFLEPLQKELHVRQGQYRAFLKKAVPQRISDLVVIAGAKAQVDIHKYLLRLGSAHWGTLRASVRRDGRFKGATDNIDIPREFALRVEEPIADAWSKQILKDIRRETKQYAADCVTLIERVVGWAKEQGARVKPRLVEAQYDAIKADAVKLDTVGREIVNELREEVKNQLIEAIDQPIRDGCRRFVKRNWDVGVGVKARILQLFSELAEEVSPTAVKPAAAILTRLFRDVEKEISSAFDAHQDPLASAAEAIVSSQENYLKRSDAQKRRKVLEELRRVLGSCPAVQTVESDGKAKP